MAPLSIRALVRPIYEMHRAHEVNILYLKEPCIGHLQDSRSKDYQSSDPL